MTTLAPVLNLVGDVGSFSLFTYDGEVWAAYLRSSGELELHRAEGGITEHRSVDVIFPKSQLSVVALGRELCIAWVHRENGAIYFSRLDLTTLSYTQEPTALFVGSSPSMKVYKTTRLIMNYRDAAGRHVYRISRDAGMTWSPEGIIIDPTSVVEVSVDVYPASENIAFWAETD